MRKFFKSIIIRTTSLGQRHPRFGIYSFIMSIAAIIFIVIFFNVFSWIPSTPHYQISPQYPAAWDIIAIGSILAAICSIIAGVILGIIGLPAKGLYKFFSILGLLFNSILVTLVGILILEFIN